MDEKNKGIIEYSVDPREYQMTLIMNLPNNTPKAAMKVIGELQKERDCLLKQNKLYKNSSTREIEATPEDITAYMKELEGEIEDLQENQLTEKNAIEYVYENSGQYEDWVEGSDLYISLQKKNKDLADFAEASVEGFAKLNADIDELKEEKYENNEFRLDLGVIMDKHDICRDEEIDVVFEDTLDENKKLKEENNVLKEDIKLLTEAGEKTSELLWSSTEKQKKLKEENEELKVKLELMECGSEEEAIARGLIKKLTSS